MNCCKHLRLLFSFTSICQDLMMDSHSLSKDLFFLWLLVMSCFSWSPVFGLEVSFFSSFNCEFLLPEHRNLQRCLENAPAVSLKTLWVFFLIAQAEFCLFNMGYVKGSLLGEMVSWGTWARVMTSFREEPTISSHPILSNTGMLWHISGTA